MDSLRGRAGLVNHNDSGDPSHCEIMFVKPLMQDSSDATAADNAERSSGFALSLHSLSGDGTSVPSAESIDANDRIDCTRCGTHIGRLYRTVDITCTCGLPCAVPPPYIVVTSARLDAMLSKQAGATASRAAVASAAAGSTSGAAPFVDMSAEYEAAQFERELAEERAAEMRKAEYKARQAAKKNKVWECEDQRGNFSQFRNKSGGKPKNKKDKDTD